jgi:hypothetical protein
VSFLLGIVTFLWLSEWPSERARWYVHAFYLVVALAMVGGIAVLERGWP